VGWFVVQSPNHLLRIRLKGEQQAKRTNFLLSMHLRGEQEERSRVQAIGSLVYS
jgi:hypothetical protein